MKNFFKVETIIGTALIVSIIIGFSPYAKAQLNVFIPASGSTGTSTLPVAGDLLMSWANGSYGPTALIAGSNVTISTSTYRQITISSTGGSGSVSTSTSETANYSAWWSSTNATPATLMSTSSMAITATGNVGIGTASPTKLLHIINSETSNAIMIDQNGNTSNSTSVGGALLLENTGNTGAGFIGYTNLGATASGRLMNLRCDNSAFDQACLHIDYDGVANAVEIVGNGVTDDAVALNVNHTNWTATAIGVSSDVENHGIYKSIHTFPSAGVGAGGNDGVASHISLDSQGIGTAVQGIFITSTTNGGGTTGKLLNLRNRTAASNTEDEYLTLTYNGKLGLLDSAPTARIDIVATSTDDYLYLSTTNTANGNIFSVLNNGNVGVASTSPYKLLSVGGDVVVGASTAGGTLGSLYLSSLGTPAGTIIAVDASGKVIATTTSAGGVTAVTGVWPITSTGGSSPSIGFNGLSTSTAAVLGNIPYFSGVNTFANVATGTVSAGSSAITVTAGRSAIGGALAIDCATSGSGQNGCLSSTDWTTFNNKQATISATYPITLTGAAVGIAFGTTTSNTWAGLQTFGNATTSLLTVSGSTWLDGITSALMLTGSTGLIAEYTGTSCSNQFVRSLSALGAATCATVGSADVSLAELTATDGTLTFSGTYTGATARTIGVNLASINSWTGGQTFANATTTGTFTLPVGATVVTPLAGNMAIDTTTGQLRYSDVNGTTRTVDPNISAAFRYATSSMGSGTTTIKISGYKHGTTFTSFGCTARGGGTFVAELGDSTSTSTPVLSSTGLTTTFTTLSSNNVFTAGESMWYAFGSVSGTVIDPSCSYSREVTAD